MATPLANELRKRRIERKLSQQQLAIKTGIKRCSIGSYEEGRSEPSLKMFFKICGALGIEINEIAKIV